MTIVAGSPFTIDYFPAAGGVTYDPVSAGGNVSLMQVYSDAGRTVLVTTAGPATKIANGQYRFSVGALGAGTYYTKITWLPATGGTNVVDANDTFVVAAADGSLGVGLGASTSQVVAPDSATPTPVPYITVPQYKAMPFGVALNTLVQGGSAAVQDRALLDIILEASRWCDNEAGQMLGASAYVDAEKVRVNAQGNVMLKAKAQPMQRVTAISLGPSPQYLNALSDLSGVWMEDDYTVEVPLTGSSSSWTGSLGFSAGAGRGGQVYALWAYQAGYPCTRLGADALAGATTVQVTDATGIVSGVPLTITDGANTEVATVNAGYYGSTLTVPLTAPLQFGHTAGDGSPGTWVGISGMPADLWRATALVVTGIIKDRGANTVTTTQTGQIGKAKGKGSVDVTSEYDRARYILQSYVRPR